MYFVHQHYFPELGFYKLSSSKYAAGDFEAQQKKWRNHKFVHVNSRAFTTREEADAFKKQALTRVTKAPRTEDFSGTDIYNTIIDLDEVEKVPPVQNKKGWVYAIKMGENLYKIGYTTKGPIECPGLMWCEKGPLKNVEDFCYFVKRDCSKVRAEGEFKELHRTTKDMTFKALAQSYKEHKAALEDAELDKPIEYTPPKSITSIIKGFPVPRPCEDTPWDA